MPVKNDSSFHPNDLGQAPWLLIAIDCSLRTVEIMTALDLRASWILKLIVSKLAPYSISFLLWTLHFQPEMPCLPLGVYTSPSQEVYCCVSDVSKWEVELSYWWLFYRDFLSHRDLQFTFQKHHFLQQTMSGKCHLYPSHVDRTTNLQLQESRSESKCSVDPEILLGYSHLLLKDSKVNSYLCDTFINFGWVFTPFFISFFVNLKVFLSWSNLRNHLRQPSHFADEQTEAQGGCTLLPRASTF